MQENKHITDEELFHRIKNNDATALRILFEKYFLALCCFAFKLVNSTHLAEEVVSDVFLKVWLMKEKIEIKTHLKAYLYAAVRNQSLNYLKKNKKYFEDLEVADKEKKYSDLNADKLITYQELKDDIDALIRQLPEKRQIIFRLNRIDGFSYKEIADILSISIHTVQNQMVAAVKFLSNRHPRHK